MRCGGVCGCDVGAFAAAEGAEDGVRAWGAVAVGLGDQGKGRGAARLMRVAGDVGRNDWIVLVTCLMV